MASTLSLEQKEQFYLCTVQRKLGKATCRLQFKGLSLRHIFMKKTLIQEG